VSLKINSAFSILVELYSEGCIEVCTPYDTNSDDCPEAAPLLLARTVIQPDADVIMYISETILTQPDIWQAHLEKVKGKINSIRKLRTFLNGCFWIFGVLLLSLGAASRLWKGQNLPIILVVLSFSVLFFCVKPLVGFLFQRCLKKQLKHARLN
jgi:hypothetical protein